MGGENFSTISYNAQLRGMHMSSNIIPQRRAYSSDGSGFTPSRSNGSPPIFNSGSYMSPLRRNSVMHETSQNTYHHMVYPESSQRTATALATSLAPPRDAGGFDRFSSFNANHSHYEANFDYDTPHLAGAASGNGSPFDRYGVSVLKNAPGGDRRSPSALSTLPTGVPSSHLPTSSNGGPFYSPSPSHGMTSYTGELSPSTTPPASVFAQRGATNKLSSGPGFDMPSMEGLDYGRHDNHLHRSGSTHRLAEAPSLLSASIPMSKASAEWGAKLNAINGSRAGNYHSSPLSSSSTTPTLSSTALLDGRLPANLSAVNGAATSIGLPETYGSLDRRSSSCSPSLDSVRADLGGRPDIPSDRIDDGLSSASSSKGQGMIQDYIKDEVEDQQQQPSKKKKKSKMHSCEICSKKFPRPSGLRTHMNTHNNARPYACGFPGCTRTFGVRSNAKRHLRTHGVVPPSAPSHNGGEPPYIVGFSPPLIAPATSESHSADASSSSGSLDGDGTNVSGQPNRRLTRAPFLTLRWMPPSLTTRSNAANLKVVDEATGEVSDDEMDSEDGDEGEHGSDRDDPNAGGKGDNKDYDDDHEGLGYGSRGMESSLPPSGCISLPTLVPLGGRGGDSSSDKLLSSSTSFISINTSYHQHHSNSYSLSMLSSPPSPNQACICPFSSCLSSPCRSLGGGLSATTSAPYPSPGSSADHTLNMGGTMRSAVGFGMGSGGMSGVGMPNNGGGGPGHGGMGSYLGMGGYHYASGSPSLYGRGVSVNAAHQPHYHVLASA